MKLVSIIFYPEPQPIYPNIVKVSAETNENAVFKFDYAEPQLILTKKAPAGEAEAFVRLF